MYHYKRNRSIVTLNLLRSLRGTTSPARRVAPFFSRSDAIHHWRLKFTRAGSSLEIHRIQNFVVQVHGKIDRVFYRRCSQLHRVAHGENGSDWSDAIKSATRTSTIDTSSSVIGENLWKRTISLLRTFIPITLHPVSRARSFQSC